MRKDDAITFAWSWRKELSLILIHLLVFRHDSLVQYADDQDAVFAGSIEDYMLLVLDAAVVLSYAIALESDLGIGWNQAEASLQAVDVADGLLRTPMVQGFVGDFDEIKTRNPGKPIGSHVSRMRR